MPPADGIESLKAAGYAITTGSYPHVWPWFYNIGATNSPFKDVTVRQALNYCIDRDGLVGLLNGTAEPSVGWLKPSDPDFGNPANHYKFDPAKGKALLAEAGYTPAKPLSFKVMISNSGSGQMLPLPMNEFLQQNLKEACGVDVEFDVSRMAGPADAGARHARQPEPARSDGAQHLARHHPIPASWRAISRRPISRRTASISSNGRTTSSTRAEDDRDSTDPKVDRRGLSQGA